MKINIIPISTLLLSTLPIFACTDSKSDTAEAENVNETTEELNDSDDISDSWADVENFESGVYTFAGSGELQSIDGHRELASFAEPTYLRQGPNGLVYIIDRMSGELRTMSLDGTVKTIEIYGEKPADPVGLAFDENGDIFISSSSEHCIYRISSGTSSVFAGTCGDSGQGYVNGQQAMFNHPKEIAFDQAGNLIVADATNSALRIISPEGVTETLAGNGEFGLITDGPALESITYFPISVTVGADNNVYFAGLDNCVRRIVDGNIETIAARCQNYSNTGSDDGDASTAMFDMPRGLYFNSNNELMILDSSSSLIRILSEDMSTIQTLAGKSPGYYDGSLEDGKFDSPKGILEIDGKYIVADSVNSRIRLVVP